MKVNDILVEDRSYLYEGLTLTEARSVKLWETAGSKLFEYQFTPDQIQQLFQQIEQGATDAGGNRTMIGQGKDAAVAVNNAWEDLKSKVQNSGPIQNVDAAYDQAAAKLKQATGGDEGVMKYVQKYRDFAKKHPIAQSLIYAALIAAAGISGAGVGGAAALGLLKMTDKLLQGNKFSSAVYQGVKTGALAYGASHLMQYLKSPDTPVPPKTEVKMPDGTMYTVKPGDTISQIAQKNGVSVKDIVDANQGQSINVSGPSADPAFTQVDSMGNQTGMAADPDKFVKMPKLGNPDAINPGQEYFIPKTGAADVYKDGVGTAADNYAKMVKGVYDPSQITTNQAVKWNVPGATDAAQSATGAATNAAQTASTAANAATTAAASTDYNPNSPQWTNDTGQKVASVGNLPNEPAKVANYGRVNPNAKGVGLRESLVDRKLTVYTWALKESVGRPRGGVQLTEAGVAKIFTLVEDLNTGTGTPNPKKPPPPPEEKQEPIWTGRKEAPTTKPDYSGGQKSVTPTVKNNQPPATAPAPAADAPAANTAPATNAAPTTAPATNTAPTTEPAPAATPAAPAEPAKKGMFGKAADWVKTKGHNLTTKITADKLQSAWKKAGSPMDSDKLSQVLKDAGVDQAVIDQAYKGLNIPTQANAPADATATNADPAPAAAPAAATATNADPAQANANPTQANTTPAPANAAQAGQAEPDPIKDAGNWLKGRIPGTDAYNQRKLNKQNDAAIMKTAQGYVTQWTNGTKANPALNTPEELQKFAQRLATRANGKVLFTPTPPTDMSQAGVTQYLKDIVARTTSGLETGDASADTSTNTTAPGQQNWDKINKMAAGSDQDANPAQQAPAVEPGQKKSGRVGKGAALKQVDQTVDAIKKVRTRDRPGVIQTAQTKIGALAGKNSTQPAGTAPAPEEEENPNIVRGYNEGLQFSESFDPGALLWKKLNR